MLTVVAHGNGVPEEKLQKCNHKIVSLLLYTVVEMWRLISTTVVMHREVSSPWQQP